MDADFWHQRWDSNQLGFHQSEVHPKLVEHIGALDLPTGSRIFVPLCGKTLDIGWLLAQGFQVAGAELSEIAINDLFAGLSVEPDMTAAGPLRRYAAPGIDIFVGDIFALDAGMLGRVDGVYDRAALVALPDTMRARYAQHLGQITDRAPQLLITFDYDQSAMDGPPFSVTDKAVQGLYRAAFQIDLLADNAMPGGLKGMVAAREQVWHLR